MFNNNRRKEAYLCSKNIVDQGVKDEFYYEY